MTERGPNARAARRTIARLVHDGVLDRARDAVAVALLEGLATRCDEAEAAEHVDAGDYLEAARELRAWWLAVLPREIAEGGTIHDLYRRVRALRDPA